jgi:hypothetical protein
LILVTRTSSRPLKNSRFALSFCAIFRGECEGVVIVFSLVSYCASSVVCCSQCYCVNVSTCQRSRRTWRGVAMTRERGGRRQGRRAYVCACGSLSSRFGDLWVPGNQIFMCEDSHCTTSSKSCLTDYEKRT